MKLFYRLLAISMAFAPQIAAAQINQGFEDPNSIAALTAQGWSFYLASWDGNGKVTQNGSLYVVPTTSTNNNAQSQNNVTQLVTAPQNLSRGGDAQFSFRLDSKLGKNSTRTFSLWLYLGPNQPRVAIGTYVVNTNFAPNTIYQSPLFNIPPVNGNARLVIDFTGDGDGNTGLYFDNLRINNAAAVMPVKLVSFQGMLAESKATLQWQVADNEIASQFELERSTNGKDFNSVALLFASEKQGNELYRITDKVQGSLTVYYRLRMQDRDGVTTYSSQIKLHQSPAMTTEPLAVWQTGSAALTLRYQTTCADRCTVVIADLSGRVLGQQNLAPVKGNNLSSLQLPRELNSGIYLVQLRQGNTLYSNKLLVP